MRKILLLIIGALPLGLMAQNRNCTINVHVDGVKFVYFDDDSVHVKNGQATFIVPPNRPLCTFTLKEHTDGAATKPVDVKYIYVEPGTIDVVVNNKDSVIFATVKGPHWSTEYDEKLRIPVDRYNLRTGLLQVSLLAAKRSSSADTAQLNLALYENIFQCFQVPQVYIKAHPDSPLCINALNMLGSGNAIAKLTTTDLERLFNSLSEATKQSPGGMAYATKLEKWKNLNNKQ